MSGMVRFKFPTARRRGREYRIQHHDVRTTGPSRAARMLALAHHIERLIDGGELSGYAEAAQALGLTRARLTQVMKLMLLAPEIQERIFIGDPRGTERRLRRVVARPDWNEQFAICERTNEDAR